MKRRILRPLLAAALLVPSMSGCFGLLYTDITTPLVVDMKNTPNPDTTKQSELAQERLTEPFLGVSVEVNSVAIGDAAQRTGLKEIYYADLRTVSVLFGLYQRKTVMVTGK